MNSKKSGNTKVIRRSSSKSSALKSPSPKISIKSGNNGIIKEDTKREKTIKTESKQTSPEEIKINKSKTEGTIRTNKIMDKLNLSINTNIFKHFIIDKMASEYIEDYKDKKNKFSIGASFVSLCVLSEFIINQLIQSVIGDNENDFNGLSEIKFMKLENKIYKQRILRQNFLSYVLDFDNKINYMTNACVNYKIVNSFIKHKISSSLKLDSETMNFICYTVHNILNKVMNICFNLMIFSNKTVIKPKIINFAISIIFTKDFYNLIESGLLSVSEIREDKTKGIKETETEDNEDLNDSLNLKEDNGDDKFYDDLFK